MPIRVLKQQEIQNRKGGIDKIKDQGSMIKVKSLRFKVKN